MGLIDELRNYQEPPEGFDTDPPAWCAGGLEWLEEKLKEAAFDVDAKKIISPSFETEAELYDWFVQHCDAMDELFGDDDHGTQ